MGHLCYFEPMKKIILIFVLACGASHAATLSINDCEIISRAIYKLEGGEKAKSPYGILSVKVSNKEEAHKICLKTISNNFVRWQKSGEKDYFNFLACKYCPPSVDPKGNFNWKKNIHLILGKEFIQKVNAMKNK